MDILHLICVVELTIALHKLFDSPQDKFLWDVGHQSYVHKILTGRAKEFGTLRQYQGLCGFPKRCESEHDVWETGHSSTSLSVAMGMALARDLKKTKEYVIPIWRWCFNRRNGFRGIEPYWT